MPLTKSHRKQITDLIDDTICPALVEDLGLTDQKDIDEALSLTAERLAKRISDDTVLANKEKSEVVWNKYRALTHEQKQTLCSALVPYLFGYFDQQRDESAQAFFQAVDEDIDEMLNVNSESAATLLES